MTDKKHIKADQNMKKTDKPTKKTKTYQILQKHFSKN